MSTNKAIKQKKIIIFFKKVPLTIVCDCLIISQRNRIVQLFELTNKTRLDNITPQFFLGGKKNGSKIMAWILGFSLISLFPACTRKNVLEIKAPGVVDGEVITLRSTVSGTIEKLKIKEGEKVRKDDLLITIDSTKIDNQIRGLDIEREDVEIHEKKVKAKVKYINSTIGYLRNQVQRYKRLKKNVEINS